MVWLHKQQWKRGLLRNRVKGCKKWMGEDTFSSSTTGKVIPAEQEGENMLAVKKEISASWHRALETLGCWALQAAGSPQNGGQAH